MLQYVKTENAPIPGGHFSQGVIKGDLLFTAGQIGQTVEKVMIQETVEDEVRQIMKNLSEVAKAAGTALENAIKTTIFITNISQFKQINAAYSEFFPENPPARSTVEVANLAVGARVEIEAIIAIPSSG